MALSFDVLIVGTGIAGLSAASTYLDLARSGETGLKVAIITKGDLTAGSSALAQGGVACVVGPPDSFEIHHGDTARAGDQLCDDQAVEYMVTRGPAKIDELVALGAKFDRTPDGDLALALEGGHSFPRVIHSNGAATGAEIVRVLSTRLDEALAGPCGITLLTGYQVVDLVVEDHRCVGAQIMDSHGHLDVVSCDHLILATGGIGNFFSSTTNPSGSTGDGIGFALRHRVPVGDIEFIQFHPTALFSGSFPTLLLSEAIRGEGGVLRDLSGERFVDELASRDVVSRAMAQVMGETGARHLWLDVSTVTNFESKFPTISRALAGHGVDLTKGRIPVAPAAHHLAGGVLVDLNGASAMPGLWACGEVAASGVHGANRLASNSLLEALVFGGRTIEAIVEGGFGPGSSGVMRQAPVNRARESAGVGLDMVGPSRATQELVNSAREASQGLFNRLTQDGQVGNSGRSGRVVEAMRLAREAMSAHAGVLRDQIGLEDLAGQLTVLARESVELISKMPAVDYALLDLVSFLEFSGPFLDSCLWRTETRGAHSRVDYRARDDRFIRRAVHGLMAPELIRG